MHGTSMCPTTTVGLSGIDFCSFPKLRTSDWPTAAGATGSTGTGRESLSRSLSPFLHFSAGNQWCLLNYWVNLISGTAVLTVLWPSSCRKVFYFTAVEDLHNSKIIRSATLKLLEKHQFENKVNDASSVFCGHWLTYGSSVQIFSWRQRQKKIQHVLENYTYI